MPVASQQPRAAQAVFLLRFANRRTKAVLRTALPNRLQTKCAKSQNAARVASVTASKTSASDRSVLSENRGLQLRRRERRRSQDGTDDFHLATDRPPGRNLSQIHTASRHRRQRRVLLWLLGSIASAVISRPAIEAASCSAVRTTLTGSITP